jgi:hypothetical protein
LTKLSVVFNSEDEKEYVVTKVAVLRIITQLLRITKKEHSDNIADSIISHVLALQTINNAAFSSKDGII